MKKNIIPFLNLARENKQYHDIIIRSISKVIGSGSFILSKQGSEFEKQFSKYCGVKYTVGTGNGLDSLTLIIRGYKELGIFKDGDQIIVPANTYIATILAITECRLVPIFVEPDINTYNIDERLIENKITSKTKAIMLVHSFGYPAKMAPITVPHRAIDIIKVP